MERRARDAYLETQIETATPQKLRLMLIDGAIGKARQTLSYWEANDQEQWLSSLQGCQNIVAELAASVNDDGSALTRTVIGVHLFLFRLLMEAQLHCDRGKVEEAIRVLEEERETWRQVCAELPEAPSRGEADSTPKEITAGGMTAIPPLPRTLESPPSGGPPPILPGPNVREDFSLEA